jgi:signal transduction histidine kinase
MRAFKTRLLHIAIPLFVLLPGLLVPSRSRAAVPVVLSDGLEPAISLRPFIDLYDDPGGQLTFDGIIRLRQDNPHSFTAFAHIGRASRDPEASSWLYATVENKSGRPRRLALVAGPSNIEQVDFYLWQRGRWQHTQAGTSVPLVRQQDFTRFPNLVFDLQPGETSHVLLKIKSDSPFPLNPVLYSTTLFRLASQTTAIFDGILIGGMSALAWSALLIYIVSRHASFLWLAAVGAAAALREAATRGYIQRLLWPPGSAWSYRLELSFDMLCVALYALFIYHAVRRDMSIPGSRIFIAIAVALLGCAAFATLLPAQVATALYQAGAVALAACALGYSIPLARGSRSAAILLGLPAILILIDAAVRTLGSPLSEPLFPVSLVLESGTPWLALLATGCSLAVLTLYSARGLRTGEHRYGAPLNASPLGENTRPAAPVRPVDARPSPASAAFRASAHTMAQAPPAGAPAGGSAGHQAMILGYVGHDLRAPLATISGYTRLLRQAVAPAQHVYLDIIERSVGYQFSLIEEILAYSRAELQPFSIKPEDTNLPALLEELARFGIALCIHNGNSFQYLPGPTLPATVSLDRKRLRQAVLNLLANAAKFTRDGAVRFEARVQREGGRGPELQLRVFNDGPTIAVEDQGEIFSAFRQLRHREAGEGLGLFIVERIAHGMGGTVRVESSPEFGNWFSLTVPIRITGVTVAVPRSIHHVPTPDGYARHVDAPPLSCRLALARLARDGELSEIEKWIQETRGVHPQYQAFYNEVVARIENFDMEGLQRLALLGIA